MLQRYSHSSLDTFRKCPRQFKFKYIDKIEIPRLIPAHLYLGNAVHRSLQTLYEWAADGKQYPLDDLLNQYQAEWDKPDRRDIVVSREHMTVDDYIENGRAMLRNYYEQYQPFDQGTTLGTELNINFQIPGCDRTFTAKIDRLWRRADGVVEICDFKTSQKLALGHTDASFYYQMGLYQLGVQEVYPQFEEIEQAQYFLKHNEVIRYRMRLDELDELTEKVRTEVVTIMDAEERENFPTKETALCDFCDYFNLCPAKRHRLILEGEEGARAGEKAAMQTAAELADRFVVVDRQIKELKAEQDALKEDIIRTAAELSLTRLAGTEGDVKVRLAEKEKLITQSEDSRKFAQASALIREWGLDTCFTLNNTIFMRDFYNKKRLSPEQSEQIAPFISVKPENRVSVERKRKSSED